MSPEAWAAYDAWNEAIAEVLFADVEDRPVYIDLEEGTLSSVAQRVGVPERQAEDELVSAVAGTLILPPADGRLLHHHVRRARRWAQREQTEVPPFLAALALLSLVAEHMVTDGELRDTNYYGRLCQVLRIDPSDERAKAKVTRDFQRQSHILWDLLNEWILDGEGARGVPTAEAFDYRVHVGVPMSQALLREADRRKLPELFEAVGLQAGQQLSVSDMARLLKDWIPQSSLSEGVKRAWGRGGVRERIAGIVCAELESWDGSYEVASGTLTISLRLVAKLTSFPRRRLQLEPLVRSAASTPEGRYQLDGETERAVFGGSEDLTLRRRVGKWLGFQGLDRMSIADLMVTPVELAHASNNVLLRRRARRVLALEEDQNYRWLAEVDRPQPGTNLMILAVDGAADKARRFLEEAARPGFREVDVGQLPGLPEPWVGFQDVQLMAIPETDDPDLGPLVPMAWTQVTLAGGLRLPGRFGAWHPAYPPEARVTAADDRPCELWLETDSLKGSEEADQEARLLEEFTEATVTELPAHLLNGDYRVVVRPPGRREATATSRLRIRSADLPQAMAVEPSQTLARGRSPWSTASAVRGLASAEGEARVQGARVVDLPARETEPGTSVQLGPAPAGEEETDDLEDLDAVRMRPSVRPASCFTTGAHHFDLPTYHGRGGPSRVEGECRNCGLERRWPARPPPRPELRDDPRAQPPERKRASTRPVEEPQPVDLDTLLDVLSYGRRGTWPAFERLARFVEDAPWFPYRAAWLLEALGHIEIERDPHSLRPMEWQVAHPAIVATELGGVLCGFRSGRLLERLADVAARQGARVEHLPRPDTPARVLVEGDLEILQRVGAELDGWWGDRVPAADRVPQRLCSILATGEKLVEALPETEPPRGVSVERFDVPSCRWEGVAEADAPGAYRFSTLPRQYLLHLPGSLRGGFRVGDARLVKHLAASLSGRLIIGYDAERQTLLAPLGAELPGLYERAAVLCSGLPPTRSEDGLLEYSALPTAVASEIGARLLEVDAR